MHIVVDREIIFNYFIEQMIKSHSLFIIGSAKDFIDIINSDATI